MITAFRIGESSTLPIFLIGSTIGYSLFWLIEFVIWRFILLRKTKQTKYILGLIFISRYTVLGGLLYFLFASIDDILYVFITCIVYFGSTWFGSKEEDAKRVTNIEMLNIASFGPIVTFAFCIGYFGGRWIGGCFGNAEIGSYIGLAIGFVVAIIEGKRLKKKRSLTVQGLQENRVDNNPSGFENDTQLS